MKTAVFVQCRLDSSRLPAKALLELGGRPVIHWVLATLGRVPADHHVLLPDDASAPVLEPFAQALGWDLCPGPRDDVLGRFVQALDHFPTDLVVRATADNPLVSLPRAVETLEATRAAGVDHGRMEGLPHGAGVEVVRAEALRRVHRESQDPFHREHVCPGVWQHPEIYRLLVVPAPPEARRPDLRITLDTLDDYRLLRAYFQGREDPSCEDYLERSMP